jgi:hypothetical protein
MFFTLKISIQRIWDDPTIFETRIKFNQNWYEKNLPIYHLSKKKKKGFTPLPLLPNLPLCEVVGCGVWDVPEKYSQSYRWLYNHV